MIKTAICDDEEYFVNELHTRVRDFFLRKRAEFRITDYASGIPLTERADEYDLIFLDVKMEDSDGFKTAELLRKNGFTGSLIFVTVMKDDAYRAFEYGTFGYLVKPLSDETFKNTMERWLKTLTISEKRIVVAQKGENSVIKTADILYCEVINRKIYLHLPSGKVTEYYGKISELEKRLGSGFFKSHRSYLVNLKRIIGYSASEITLDGGERIPMSRGRRSALTDALLDDMESGAV